MPRRTQPLTELSKKGLRLFQYYDDGRVKWCRNDPGPLAAHEVDPENIPSFEESKRLIREASNKFLGSLVGKTVLIFGTGPQIKRFNSKYADYLSKREDLFIIGINAAPAICGKMWKYDPNDFFDLLVAADVVFRTFFNAWGWVDCKSVKRYCFWRYFDGLNHPIEDAQTISRNVVKIYRADSVTACIGIVLCGLATEINTETTPHSLVKAEGGRVILVGVEANHYNHAYTGEEGFYLGDNPELSWPTMQPKLDYHAELGRFAKEIGTDIANASPWSVIESHRFIDFEEELNIPNKIRTGITTKGKPEKGKAKYKPEEATKYRQQMLRGTSASKLKAPQPVI